MTLQEKLTKLNELLDNIKSEKQKSYAKKLLLELITEFNKVKVENEKLFKRKLNMSMDLDAEKYILALMIYGFTQESIQIVHIETLKFVKQNRHNLRYTPLANNIMDIQFMLYDFELSKERKPKNFNEFKDYVNECRKYELIKD